MKPYKRQEFEKILNKTEHKLPIEIILSFTEDQQWIDVALNN